jgi:D-alanine-D-alanine ligase
MKLTPGSRTQIDRYGKVAVLMGGRSSEREISLLSGAAVLHALQFAGVNAIGIDASSDLIPQLISSGVERAFIILHGSDGEDGKVQGALEWLGIPYTGSGVLASALTMDKVFTKRIWLQNGLPTPAFRVLNANDDWDAVLSDLGPCFVKPVSGGSSLGISSASTAAELQQAYEIATQYQAEVIAETWLRGKEYTVGILGQDILPIVAMQSTNAFYDYQAKYFSEETRYECPAHIDIDVAKEMQELALKAYRSVGCKGWGRVDLMTDACGNMYLLEVNTTPGMTSHSLVPMAAKQLGIDFPTLVLRILESSFPPNDLVGGQG